MADSPALLISPSPVGAEGRFQRHKRKGRPGELSRYGALPRTPCGARRKRMLLYLVSFLPKGKSGAVQRWRMRPTVGIFTLHGRAVVPAGGPVCLVFWADRGPGASCPYGEGPRRALVTFPRWKVTRGDGGAAPQNCPQARFDVSRRRRLLAKMMQRPGKTRIGGLSKPACGHSAHLMVLSTGRKYPKPAGAFRSAPDP